MPENIIKNIDLIGNKYVKENRKLSIPNAIPSIKAILP